MATVRQPVGTVFGKALNLHELLLPKGAKDAIFRGLERALNVFSFTLTATGDLAPCEKESEKKDKKTIFSEDSGSDSLEEGSTADGIGDSVEKAITAEQLGKLAAKLSEFSGLLEELPFEPALLTDTRTETPKKVCCKLDSVDLDPDSNPTPPQKPQSQKLKFEIKFDVTVDGVKVASVELEVDVTVEYRTLGKFDVIRGKCPALCSDEVRDITVSVRLSGKLSAKLTILDFDDLFGKNVQTVDLSILPDVNRTSLSIGDVGPSGGTTIEFGGELTNFNEPFVFRFSCKSGRGSTLQLVQSPYPFTMTDTGFGASPMTPGMSVPPGTNTGTECSVISFRVPTGRTGCRQRKRGNLTEIYEEFKMEADFENVEGRAECKCCEYRQEVRGQFIRNGVPIAHPLPDPARNNRPRLMLPRPPGGGDGNFREDGLAPAPPGSNIYYGHRRDSNNPPEDQYLPNRATGCRYRGSDEPVSTQQSPKDTLSMDLDYRGRIIDTCNGGFIEREAVWTVRCNLP